MSKKTRIRRARVDREVQARYLRPGAEMPIGERSLVRMLEREMKRLDKPAPCVPMVSEHAMLRYLERVLGVDLNAIADAILTDPVREAMRNLGNGKFPSGTGFRVVVSQNTVVTVVK